MGLEDNKDLSACSDERVIKSVDRAHDRYYTMEGCQRNDMLSETWHELLGIHALEASVDGEGAEGVEGMAGVAAPEVPIGLLELSSFEGDPWSELLHMRGVELVDLQHSELATVHVSLSEVEVEQALQIMQEQAIEEGGQG